MDEYDETVLPISPDPALTMDQWLEAQYFSSLSPEELALVMTQDWPEPSDDESYAKGEVSTAS